MGNGIDHSVVLMLTRSPSVLNPEPFDRRDLTPEAPASDRVAFANASPVEKLPFSSISFVNDLATYTTPALLSTMIAVATPTSGSDDEHVPVPTSGATGRGVVMGAVAIGIAIALQ